MTVGLIGFDATPSASGHGIRGIGRYVRSVLEALTEEQGGWTRENLGVLLAPGQSCPLAIASAWRTHRSRIRAQDTDWAIAAVADRLATRSSRVALWHETDPGLPLGMASADRTIMTAYDLIPLLDPVARRRMRPHRWAIHRLYLHQLTKARAVIAISEATAIDVERHLDVDPSRIHVVYPPVRAPLHFGPVSRHDLPEPRPLLFVGVPDPHKRADLAIRVLAALRRSDPRRQLIFVGHHPPAARSGLRAIAERLSVSGAVRFHETVTDTELMSLYAGGTLLALSTREGFGLPPVECLLAGGRAVAVPTAIYREVLGNAAVFAADDEPTSIADAVTVADGSSPSPAAVAWLATRYAPSAVANAIVAVYRMLSGSQ